MAQTIKKYQKKSGISYTFGAFPTFELLLHRPETVKSVYVHSALNSPDTEEKLTALCREKHVRLIPSDKTVEKLREKDNIFIIGVFEKAERDLAEEANHVVLVSPSDMGNVGTILRACLGFGIHDIAIIEPAADVWNPKTVRASMGAMFRERLRYFNSFEEYEQRYGEGRDLYPFVLHGREVLQKLDRDPVRRYALIFGKEATGLPKTFETFPHSITIRQSDEVDSFNLSLAVGMALYKFTEGDNNL